MHNDAAWAWLDAVYMLAVDDESGPPPDSRPGGEEADDRVDERP